ncbi:MAG TPA: hypothetical protein PK513_04170 [Alphaproteobacteria bacterium]|nr:hypothetical protein [Alphaproteobacteria bacterium]USO05612.1 MAG: hypothetical protein H6859_10925 [Rhodospirillales bacterium]HOO81678.1 hypothetical protein [Alphaproteobacteria bacterium]
MIDDEDYKSLLFPYNLIGDDDGLSETALVPDQEVHKIGIDYIIEYSFFTSQSDILYSGYYLSTDEEVVKFIGSSDYQQNIEDNLRLIFAPSLKEK